MPWSTSIRASCAQILRLLKVEQPSNRHGSDQPGGGGAVDGGDGGGTGPEEVVVDARGLRVVDDCGDRVDEGATFVDDGATRVDDGATRVDDVTARVEGGDFTPGATVPWFAGLDVAVTFCRGWET